MGKFKEFLGEGWKHCSRCGAKTMHKHEFFDNEGNAVDRTTCTMCKTTRDIKRRKKSDKTIAHKKKIAAAMDRLLKDDE